MVSRKLLRLCLLRGAQLSPAPVRSACMFRNNVADSRPFGVFESLVNAVGAVGVAVDTVGDWVAQSVNALWTRSVLGSVALVARSRAVLRTIRGIIIDDRLVCDVVFHTVGLLLGRLGVFGVASVAGIDVGLNTGTLPWIGLHHLLVLTECRVHLVHRDVVEENTLAERAWDSGPELAVTGLSGSAVIHSIYHAIGSHLEDGLGTLVKDLLVELWVIHGQTGAREKVEVPLEFLLAEQTPDVGKGGRVGHVNGDGVAVAEWCLGHQLVQRRPSVMM